MSVLQLVLLVATAAAGTGVVTTRDPLPQSIAAGFYGLILTLLFLAMQAPDVALSEMVIGAVAYPLIVLITVAKTEVKGAE